MALRLRRAPRLTAKMSAYPYQLDAMRAVVRLPYAAILHEQGLGKTKIAIDILLFWLAEDQVDTAIVVTKKSLIQNWIDEFRSHSYITPRLLSNDHRANSVALNSPVLVYVTNYEAIKASDQLISEFVRTCRVGAVLDESQKIKNPYSKLSLCFHDISDSLTKRVIMTGTPVANRPYDIWSQIKFLDGGAALGTSFERFKATFDLPRAHSSVDYGRQLATIMDRIRPFSVRETKQTSGVDLPQKTIITHCVEMAPQQSDIYKSYRDHLRYELSDVESLVIDDSEYILKRLLRLVQCASNPGLVDQHYSEIPAKAVRLMSILQDSDLASTKAVVWTSFVGNVKWLRGYLGDYHPRVVYGQMAIADRNHAIETFKSDDRCRVLIATPGAAKEGLTLTVATHAVFYDRAFSLDDYLQAQDRIHRISQTESCFVHNLICTDTIDAWIDALLNAKHQAAKLAQGDVSCVDIEATLAYDMIGTLSGFLTPSNRTDSRDE